MGGFKNIFKRFSKNKKDETEFTEVGYSYFQSDYFSYSFYVNIKKNAHQEHHEHHEHQHHHITVDNISVISNVSEVMEGDEEKRETWTGKFDFFLSALGYAGKI